MKTLEMLLRINLIFQLWNQLRDDGGFCFLCRAWAPFERTDKFVNVVEITLFNKLLFLPLYYLGQIIFWISFQFFSLCVSRKTVIARKTWPIYSFHITNSQSFFSERNESNFIRCWVMVKYLQMTCFFPWNRHFLIYLIAILKMSCIQWRPV